MCWAVVGRSATREPYVFSASSLLNGGEFTMTHFVQLFKPERRSAFKLACIGDVIRRSGCALPPLVQTVPHVAFRVDDLEAALEGKEVLITPNSPSPGIRVAFIVENGAPVEFLEDRTLPLA